MHSSSCGAKDRPTIKIDTEAFNLGSFLKQHRRVILGVHAEAAVSQLSIGQRKHRNHGHNHSNCKGLLIVAPDSLSPLVMVPTGESHGPSPQLHPLELCLDFGNLRAN